MSVLVLTDRRLAVRPLTEVVSAAVAGGARSVVLREKDLPRPARLSLAADLWAILRPVGGRLIVAGPDPLDGDAVHLSASDPLVAGLRAGRSCHNAEELARLSTEDYATLSPVFTTASKPGYGPALGVDGLAALVASTATPVLALGGIAEPARAGACVAAGAAGVAVLGAVMRAEDPGAVVAKLVAEVGA